MCEWCVCVCVWCLCVCVYVWCVCVWCVCMCVWCVWCVCVCVVCVCVYVCVVVCVFVVCVCVWRCSFAVGFSQFPVSTACPAQHRTRCCAVATPVCVWSGYCFRVAGVDFESSFPSAWYILIICYFFCKFKLLYQVAQKPNDTRCLTPVFETPGISSRWQTREPYSRQRRPFMPALNKFN